MHYTTKKITELPSSLFSIYSVVSRVLGVPFYSLKWSWGETTYTIQKGWHCIEL